MISLEFSSNRAIPFVLLIVEFAFPRLTANGQNWDQIGANILGDAALHRTGSSVSLSDDGGKLAIGSPGADGTGLNAGRVRVYERVGMTWVQQGADIESEAADDGCGRSVCLSADGSIVAIGAYRNTGNGAYAGHVRVYGYTFGDWTQLGADIDGEAAGDQSGISISLSADGMTLAIGALNNAGLGPGAGHVRVFKYMKGAWIQHGSDIDGEAPGDASGWSVSMSDDGTTVAIGAWGNSGNGANAGHVRVYSDTNGSWVQRGADIDGEAAGDRSGHCVSLSADGNILAVGSPFNDGNGVSAGHVRVYAFVAGNWTPLGSAIDGDAADDRSGLSVSLSADGSTVAIGAPLNSGSGEYAGRVRVFQFTTGEWTPLGAEINGVLANENTGHSVCLSADRSTLAIGAPFHDANGNFAGLVRVFGSEDGVDVEDNLVRGSFSIFPNPTTKLVSISLGHLNEVDLRVFNMTGQLLYERTGIRTATHRFELNGAAGVHMIEITSKGQTQRYKLIKE